MCQGASASLFSEGLSHLRMSVTTVIEVSGLMSIRENPKSAPCYELIEPAVSARVIACLVPLSAQKDL